MRRATVNFIVDAIAFLALLCLTVTGLLLKYAPRGGGRGPGESRDWLGVSHHVWGDIHFIASVVFVVLILVHVVLHWTWIQGSVKSMFVPSACQSLEGEGRAQNK
jgi:hypothetical protein